MKSANPPPDLTVSQWADRYRYLSTEASAEAGKWRTDRFEAQRGPMDAISDPAVEQVVVMKSAQTGFTEVALNTLGFHIDYDPAPILVLQPDEKMAEVFSKDRLAPMVRDSPTLRGRVSDPKSRDSGNTILHKKFLGGQLAIVGANAPSGLASRPVRVVICDEVDRYPESAGTEGDPVDLAFKRTTTFWNRKLILISTPTIKGVSRIEKAYEETDKRVPEVPCPHCGHYHVLRWSNVIWNDSSPAKGDPAKAVLQCPECAKYFTNAQKNAAVKRLRWRATAPFNGKAGFWINEIYSPWTTLGQMAKRFLEVKGDPARLVTFVNTALAETWDGEAATVSDDALLARSERYAAPVPERGLVLTAGVDTQPDRLEVEIVAWGAGEESWSISHHVLHGDPDIGEGQPGSPWTALTDLLRTPLDHEWGLKLPVAYTCVDSGGANTQAVYQYCKAHRGERIFAVKGRGGVGIPVISAPARKRMGKVKRPVDVFIVGVDQAKDTLMRRLAITESGPGCCHFPYGRDAEWFRQLTAEKRVTKYHKGVAKREWVKIQGRRNEALDCRVYAYAALLMHAPQMDKVAFRLRRDRDALLAKQARATAALATAPVRHAEPDTEKTAQDPQAESGHHVEAPAEPAKPKKQRRRASGYLHQW